MSINAKKDFGPFDGKSWINCAHQGPLPRVSVEALRKALDFKVKPFTLQDELFSTVPKKLKDSLGKLVNVNPDEVIIGNSTSYGLHLLANGILWNRKDEVLLVEGDFPADILPWLGLKSRGIHTKFIKTPNSIPTSDDVEKALTNKTRVFCTTWVNSFTGHVLDIESIGEVCRENGTRFVLNGSQAVGARVLDLKRSQVDALVCGGYKWLCGPYGTGFCWIEPSFLGEINYNQSYWLTMQEGKSLDKEMDSKLVDDLGAKRYDVFGTASFNNVMPWTASIEYLVSEGLSNIEDYDLMLVNRLIDGIGGEKYKFISSVERNEVSSIVVLDNKAGYNKEVYDSFLKRGLFITLRNGRIRISPHLYNTVEEIDASIELLNSF